MEDGQLELMIGKEEEINPEKDFQRLKNAVDGQFPLGVAFPPTEEEEFYATIMCDPRNYKAIASQIDYNLTKYGGLYIRQWRRRFYVPCKN